MFDDEIESSVEDTNGGDGLKVRGVSLDKLSVGVAGEFPESHQSTLRRAFLGLSAGSSSSDTLILENSTRASRRFSDAR